MNIMLVTVTERTREIGIRKAIGARTGDILGQFLTEAVLLSVLGGVLGVAAGLVGSRFKIVGVQPVVAGYSVALAFGVGVAVGLFFGIYPAKRAATLRRSLAAGRGFGRPDSCNGARRPVVEPAIAHHARRIECAPARHPIAAHMPADYVAAGGPIRH